MRSIMVATDYSPEANNALEYAAEAAAQLGLKVILFHLDRVSIHALNGRASSMDIENAIASHKNKLRQEATRIAEQYHIDTDIFFGSEELLDEIEKCIQRFDIEMVVIGMAPKSFEQDLLGNTTTKVLHSLKVPTLAIPATVKYHPIKNILFAVDVMRGLQKRIFERVSSFAKDFGAQIEVFYVSQKVQELQHSSIHPALEEMHKDDSSVQFLYKNVQSAEIIEAIKEEIEAYHADVLVMVPYKYGFWNSIVHRSKTSLMASGNKVPLLSIPL